MLYLIIISWPYKHQSLHLSFKDKAVKHPLIRPERKAALKRAGKRMLDQRRWSKRPVFKTWEPWIQQECFHISLRKKKISQMTTIKFYLVKNIEKTVHLNVMTTRIPSLASFLSHSALIITLLLCYKARTPTISIRVIKHPIRPHGWWWHLIEAISGVEVALLYVINMESIRAQSMTCENLFFMTPSWQNTSVGFGRADSGCVLDKFD